MHLSIPDVLARNVIGFRGEDGRQWLARLPELVTGYVESWNLEPGEPCPGMSYNYLCFVSLEDGADAVLKLGVPGGPVHSEADALRAFDGRACVRLLRADRAAGVLLLERVRPGATLDTIEDDDAATGAAAEVMARVRRPAPGNHPFATVRKWSEGLARLRVAFDGSTGPFPKEMVERAEALYAELLDNTTASFLLHGDLHHANLLSAGREPWLAIDPQGVVGDPAYEAAPFLRNNLSGSADPAGTVARRARIIAETMDLDPGRLLDWARAESVLSAWWCYEDNDPAWREAITLAGTIESAAHRRS